MEFNGPLRSWTSFAKASALSDFSYKTFLFSTCIFFFMTAYRIGRFCRNLDKHGKPLFNKSGEYGPSLSQLSILMKRSVFTRSWCDGLQTFNLLSFRRGMYLHRPPSLLYQLAVTNPGHVFYRL